MKFSWFEFDEFMKQRQNDLSLFPNSNHVHCCCVLFQQHASYVSVRVKGLHPLHISTTRPTWCVATLKLLLTLICPPFSSFFLICHRCLCYQQRCQFCGFFTFLGESKTQVTNVRLNDNNWHKVHLTRDNQALSIKIDGGLGSGKLLSHI